MPYPALFTTPGLKTFAEAVDAERSRQLHKFGDQRHPDGTGSPTQQSMADIARQHCEDAFGAGYGTWADVFDEEVAEAKAERDPALLRAELVQVAAVCAAWISDLDRRPAEAPPQRGDRVVAYRNPERPGTLLCREHAEVYQSRLVPVTSEDLPDGGICIWGRPGPHECGRDVLAGT